MPTLVVYIQFFQKINNSKKSLSKEFYIIIESEKNEKINKSKEIIENELNEKYFKIKECLARCGNKCYEINEEDKIVVIYKNFFYKKE